MEKQVILRRQCISNIDRNINLLLVKGVSVREVCYRLLRTRRIFKELALLYGVGTNSYDYRMIYVEGMEEAVRKYWIAKNRNIYYGQSER